MITVNPPETTAEIESLGGWLLDGKPVPSGQRLTVPTALAADLIARNKARRAPPDVAPVEPVAIEADPETPPAPAPAARGKK